MLIYKGPSRLDQSPIVAILTGVYRPSSNAKTGPMAQLWILPDNISPLSAVHTGRDYCVCGDCQHKPSNDGTCYVSVGRAPQAVWRKYKLGRHPYVSPAAANAILRERELSARLGAWGEPTALPYRVLEELVDGIPHTGYTHQSTWNPMYRHLLMASIDRPADLARAQDAGWRTFRVRLADEPILSNEVTCPASAEAGHRTTCESCNLCAGASKQAKSVVIQVHGNGTAKYIQVRRVE